MVGSPQTSPPEWSREGCMCRGHYQANTAHIYATENTRDQQMTELVGIPLLIVLTIPFHPL